MSDGPRADRSPFGHGLIVVAEVGVNHNGDTDLALRHLRAAVASGADAVKLQTFRAEELASASAGMAAYQRTSAPSGSQREMLAKLELGADALRALFAEAEHAGVVFFSAPFDPRSVELLAALGARWMKVPSGEITHTDLVREVGRTGLPTVMSTGMAMLDEVRSAVSLHQESGGGPLALLHCVSSYPAPLERMELRAMVTLREAFGVPVGLSDHSIGRDAAVAAVALGADVIEKHFTVDPTLPGPDQAMSMAPDEFAAMVDTLRRVRSGLGSGEKRPTVDEAEISAVARRSIVTARPVRAGAVIAREDLAFKRPGTGLAPAEVGRVIGKRARTDIAADRLLALDDLEP
jgi:N-acetylneuraminate synthase/N,N'-diacetyllegionaminate synthase